MCNKCENIATERQVVGEMKIKETKIRITGKPYSSESVTTVERRTTGHFIVGQKEGKI